MYLFTQELRCAVSSYDHLMRQYRACVVDSLGLGITVLCIQTIPILSHLLFMPSLYSTFNFEYLLVPSHCKTDLITFLVLLTILVQAGIQQCYKHPEKSSFGRVVRSYSIDHSDVSL